MNDYEPVALTVMVTLTGSLSSPGAGAWLVVALMGEVVRGEDARGKAMVGPGKDQCQGSESGTRAKRFSDLTMAEDRS